jgi:PT repeat
MMLKHFIGLGMLGTIGLVGILFSPRPGLAQVTVAQVTITSTGVVAGTVTPPNRNPTFNQGTTRINTDSQGRYFRNGQLIFNAQDINPNLVGIDSKGQFFVDFRGIPIVAVDGSLTSAILDGQLTAVQRFNHNTPVKLWGNVQDELVVQGEFTGTAIDPATGNQYQGTFTIKGQGPRYSDPNNGGTSPTVFDFKSYYNNFNANPQILPKPTVSSYSIQAMPVKLTVTVPAGLQPVITPIQPMGQPTGQPTGQPAIQPMGQPMSQPSASPTASQLSNPSNNPTAFLPNRPAIAGSIFATAQSFELNHVVVTPQPPRPIGPRSRIILR